jgi:hypothetical protein
MWNAVAGKWIWLSYRLMAALRMIVAGILVIVIQIVVFVVIS